MAEYYILTVPGFDAMEVLNAFHRKAEELGVPREKLNLSYEEIVEGVTAEPTKDALPFVLKQMMDAGLIYRES